MKRTLIRISGTLIAFFATFNNNASARVTDIAAWNCGELGAEEFLPENSSGVIYRKGHCINPGLPQPSCTTGYISYDLVNQYSQCASGSGGVQPFSECYNGRCCQSGSCTSSYIYCQNPDFFASGWGCSDVTYGGAGTGSSCSYVNGRICPTGQLHLVFSRCQSGYYESEEYKDPAILYYGSGQTGLEGYCYPCSGFTIQSGEHYTYPNTAGLSESDNFYWVGTRGMYGLTACVAYIKGGGTGVDNRGTFMFPQGCRYAN